MIKLIIVKKNIHLRNYYEQLINDYKFKKTLVIFDTIKNFKTYKLKNNEFKILIDSPFFKDNNFFKFYINNINLNTQNLLKINSNEINEFESRFNLKYSNEWRINKEGYILILLSNSNGWYKNYPILKLNNIMILIKKIRKISNKIIKIKLHRKDYKYITKKLRKPFKKWNCHFFINEYPEELNSEPNDIYCIISDMTFYAFRFAFEGIPLFNFNKDILNNIPTKDIALNEFNMLNPDNINFEKIMNRDDFFNKLLTYHFSTHRNDLLNKLESILNQ